MAANWPAIRAGIFKGESGGDYNTLYGHVEKNGPFAGTRLSDMTVDQALAFNAPSGPYGQYARSKGIAAAPLGAYQIIHSTLKGVKNGMGLSGNERMTPDLQEKMGQYIYSKQGTGAWAGYRGPGDPSAFPSPSPPLSPGAMQFAANNPQPGGFGSDVSSQLGDKGVGGSLEGSGPKYEPAPFGSMAPGGGMMAQNNSIDPNVAKYAFADDKNPIGNRLSKAGELFSKATEAPRLRPGPFPGGPSGEQANGLLKATNNTAQLAQMLLGRRMA